MKSLRNFSLYVVLLSCPFALANFAPRHRPIDVKHYRLSLAVDPSTAPKEFEATLEITLQATADLNTLELDAKQLRVRKVVDKTTGAALVFRELSPEGLEISRALKKGQTLTLKIDYVGAIGTANEGLFLVRDPDDAERGPLLATHFEPTHARRFLPCHDEPTDKATTEVLIQVPPGFTALSNGKLLGSTKGKFHWKMPLPHSTYLLSLAIGRYSKLKATHRTIPIGYFVGSKRAEKARFGLQTTQDSLQFLESYLGVPYPWPAYNTVGVPTFVWGGMENTGSTHANEERMLLNDPLSSSEKLSVAGLLAHELAHQWFGNYATLKWWDDLWLNEAFASYLDTVTASALLKSDAPVLGFLARTWNEYFRQEDGPRSHPIVNPQLQDPEEAFDAIAYTKGQNILRMLNFHIGEKAFRNGLKLYLQSHRLGNATYLDLFKAMEKASGTDLAEFRDSWLLNRGYPVLSYSTQWDPAAKKYTVRFTQRPNHPEEKTVFSFRLPVAVHRRSKPAYSQTAILDFNQKDLSWSIELPEKPDWITVNREFAVLAKVENVNPAEELLQNQSRAQWDPDAISRLRSAYALLAPLAKGDKVTPVTELVLAQVLLGDSNAYVRTGLVAGMKRAKTKWLPSLLAEKTLAHGKRTFETAEPVPKEWDELAKNLWRAELLGILGKIQSPAVSALLTQVLERTDLPLDELSNATLSVALLGSEQSGPALEKALSTHGKRGYAYAFACQIAHGALESEDAILRLKSLLKTTGADLWARMPRYLRNNQRLQNSPEWAAFLEEFVLTEERMGDEVKSRLLQTVEEIKSPATQALFKKLLEKSTSARIREVATTILKKHWP